MKKRVSCENHLQKKFDRTEISAWSASGQYEGGLRTPHHDVPKSSYAGIIRIRLRVRASAHLSRPSGSRGPVGLLPGSAPLIFVPPPPAQMHRRRQRLLSCSHYTTFRRFCQEIILTLSSKKTGKFRKTRDFCRPTVSFQKIYNFKSPPKSHFSVHRKKGLDFFANI
jgi:hypothetical protein